MSKVSAHGGFWVVAANPLVPGDENKVVHNAACEVSTAREVHETRSAGCGGWTEGLPVINRVESLTMSVAEDDTAYPQALGMTEGAELILWLKRGALNQYDVVYRTIVTNVRVVNDQQKARRVEITCKHGAYVRGAIPPVFATDDTELSGDGE